MDGDSSAGIARFLWLNARFPVAIVACFCLVILLVHRYRRIVSPSRMQVKGALWEVGRKSESTGLPPEMARLVPPGYFVQGMYQGDLDLNGVDDFAMVVAREDEDSLAETTDRPVHRDLLLVLSRPDGSFHVAIRHPRALYCTRCGGIMGDPLEEISVDSGRFTIQQYGGAALRWSRTTRFSFDRHRADWYLDFDSTESFPIAQPDDASRHTATPIEFGSVKLRDFDVYKTTGI
ncbi:MAG TPA: hypothetical protein PKO15_11110 [Fibrobacteria bacterium]|nr:hypothetical protein [Fibrobacteria bacterium]HOX50884.1 hypothetical protein [Fibrobacteria bacterium]